jgi:hypothetical protein
MLAQSMDYPLNGIKEGLNDFKTRRLARAVPLTRYTQPLSFNTQLLNASRCWHCKKGLTHTSKLKVPLAAMLRGPSAGSGPLGIPLSSRSESRLLTHMVYSYSPFLLGARYIHYIISYLPPVRRRRPTTDSLVRSSGRLRHPIYS